MGRGRPTFLRDCNLLSSGGRISIKVWPFLTRCDKIFITFLILVNLSLIFWMKAGGSERKVMVEVDQEVVGIYDLDSPGRIVRARGPAGISEIEIREGRARMLSSPCPEQTCVKTGWIDSHGQIICCVPNKIIIWISDHEKRSPDQFDGITR